MLPAENLGTRLSLSKRADNKTVTPGETITWRLRLRNAGEAAAVNVRVCDALPRAWSRCARRLHAAGGALCRTLGHLGVGDVRAAADHHARVTLRAAVGSPTVASAHAANARRVRARASVGRFEPCAAAARRRGPVARAAC